MGTITPRWLTHLLQWIPVKPVTGSIALRTPPRSRWCSDHEERVLPQTFADYQEHPREYRLNAVNTVLDVHTRVSDLYGNPYNQNGEQLRLTIETVKERQESELINNPEYGLLNKIHRKISAVCVPRSQAHKCESTPRTIPTRGADYLAPGLGRTAVPNSPVQKSGRV